MPAPFYLAIKGTTAGAAGTGAFTPNAGSAGFRAWSTVPTGWWGLVRYEDGTDWELSWSYWNGTTLSRGANQLYDSSTGARINLTAAATAAMIADPADLMANLGTKSWRGAFPPINSTSAPTTIGMVITVVGTAAAATVASTNILTQQMRGQTNSATTANAMAGFFTSSALALVSTTAGLGGMEFSAEWGFPQLPTGPRMFVGACNTTTNGDTAEPSAKVAHYAAFAKDSTDTTIQFLTNSGAGGGTKIDTGIALVSNAWYASRIWFEPGSNKAYGLLVRVDTGEIWYGSTTVDVPATGQVLRPDVQGSLNGTNTGTALQICMGQLVVRGGF